MEDILKVYKQQFDPLRPLVCMDECPKQLLGESREPIAGTPGHPAKYDTEYTRNGTCDLFMFSAPLLGFRTVNVTEKRTATDWAEQIRHLVDVDFPWAEKIILVMDNLNTHEPASLYKAFTPQEARRILEHLEIHYTPKHGSWLNMAEIELSVLNRTGLPERVSTIEQMSRQVKAWAESRNRQLRTINWRFATEDARIKLARLYPQLAA